MSNTEAPWITRLKDKGAWAPLCQTAVWWPELVNGVLLGYIPAVILIAHRGIDRDFSQL